MDYGDLSDAALLARLRELAATERRATADFLACLGEADRRPRAIAAEGYPSLFAFCVGDLKLAESTAYQRVHAAREANRRPEILSRLADGTIHLSALCLIAPLLHERPELLKAVENKSKREVETLVASLGEPRLIPDRIRLIAPPAQQTRAPELFDGPMPSVAPSTLALPGSTTPASAEARQPTLPSAESTTTPSAAPVPPRQPSAEFRFTAGPEFVTAVERLRAILWHKHPAGRLEDILLEAANDFLARRDPSRERRLIAIASPASPESRRIPAAIRRLVWRRDGGRCAYVGAAGRCAETRGLEADHVVPWALGGSSNDPANLRLLCRAHNQAEAERIFGAESTRVDSGG